MFFHVYFQADFKLISQLGVLLCFASGLGVTAGAHRLWTHRAYKAKLPLRIFLAYCNCMALQVSTYYYLPGHKTKY